MPQEERPQPGGSKGSNSKRSHSERNCKGAPSTAPSSRVGKFCNYLAHDFHRLVWVRLHEARNCVGNEGAADAAQMQICSAPSTKTTAATQTNKKPQRPPSTQPPPALLMRLLLPYGFVVDILCAGSAVDAAIAFSHSCCAGCVVVLLERSQRWGLATPDNCDTPPWCYKKSNCHVITTRTISIHPRWLTVAPMAACE